MLFIQSVRSVLVELVFLVDFESPLALSESDVDDILWAAKALSSPLLKWERVRSYPKPMPSTPSAVLRVNRIYQPPRFSFHNVIFLVLYSLWMIRRWSDYVGWGPCRYHSLWTRRVSVCQVTMNQNLYLLCGRTCSEICCYIQRSLYPLGIGPWTTYKLLTSTSLRRVVSSFLQKFRSVCWTVQSNDANFLW